MKDRALDGFMNEILRIRRARESVSAPMLATSDFDIERVAQHIIADTEAIGRVMLTRLESIRSQESLGQSHIDHACH